MEKIKQNVLNIYLKSTHFEDGMALFIRIGCRIHKKYKFWNFLPIVASICHFGIIFLVAEQKRIKVLN
jgi:hypothetical protein